ncbi:MAG: ECF transporter S component [Oscillospiraceae bacterium]|nr:ECF transporter S component [Oscillospiraceae bacterium]
MNHENIKRLVGAAVLAAIVVVLQMIVGAVKIGPVSFTLSLVPIVIGAAYFGPGTGGFLGGVFGLIVYIGCVNGTDVGGNILFVANPFLCCLTCMVKGIASGLCSGLVYRLCAKKATALGHHTLAVIPAAIVAPVVNTGLFCLAMVLFFKDTLYAWAGDQPVMTYMLFGLAGINFLVELGVNLVLSPGISTAIRAIDKSRS